MDGNEVWIEANIDRVVGPTHHFGGLGIGNLASLAHGGRPAQPRAAAIQGVEKMRLVASLGGHQLVLPPQSRPSLRLLRRLGFTGSLGEMLAQAQAAAPVALSAAWSDAAMWTANAATVTAACDARDGRQHVSVANLISSLHRSIEPRQTFSQLRALLGPVGMAVHGPLPAAMLLRDEGAANHMRLCDASGTRAINLFVYGSDGLSGEAQLDFSAAPTGTFPARQTRQACEAIARRHRLRDEDTFFLRQHPAAIAAGAFHNDVVATSCQNLLVHHELAFAPGEQLQRIEQRFAERTGGAKLWRYEVPEAALPLQEAVACYLFNSQMIPSPAAADQIVLLCPTQVAQNPRAVALIQGWIADAGPIAAVHYLDLTQSMNNGGGPACLRLRVPMTQRQWSERVAPQARLTETLADRLIEVIERHYPQEISPAELADPRLAARARAATAEIRRLIAIPNRG